MTTQTVVGGGEPPAGENRCTWQSAFMALEDQICGLARMAKIVELMTIHDAEENEWKNESLALVAVEQLEKMTAEVKQQWYELHKQACGADAES